MPKRRSNVDIFSEDQAIADELASKGNYGLPEIMMKLNGAPQELIDILKGLREEADWQGLSANMTFYSRWLPHAFCSYYECVPDEHRYNFCMHMAVMALRP